MNSYMKSRDEVIHIQNKHLKRQLERIYNNSPFYRKKMDTHGILPGDIRDLDDLRKYTTKDEIIAHNERTVCSINETDTAITVILWHNR